MNNIAIIDVIKKSKKSISIKYIDDPLDQTLEITTTKLGRPKSIFPNDNTIKSNKINNPTVIPINKKNMDKYISIDNINSANSNTKLDCIIQIDKSDVSNSTKIDKSVKIKECNLKSKNRIGVLPVYLKKYNHQKNNAYKYQSKIYNIIIKNANIYTIESNKKDKDKIEEDVIRDINNNLDIHEDDIDKIQYLKIKDLQIFIVILNSEKKMSRYPNDLEIPNNKIDTIGFQIKTFLSLLPLHSEIKKYNSNYKINCNDHYLNLDHILDQII